MQIGSRGLRRAGVVVLTALGVLVLATCDLATIVGTTPANRKSLDSTSFTLTGIANLTLGGSGTLVVTAPGVDLTGVSLRFASAAPSIVAIDSVTGIYTAVGLGTARLTASVLAPELGPGITVSADVRVRYKGIKLVSPVPGDSIQGAGQTRAITVRGLNATDVLQASALVPDSLRSTDPSTFVVAGSSVRARKTGSAFLVAVFDNFRDSVAVRVRQVAKSITFPTTDFIATSVNTSFNVPVVVRDVADSIIATPVLTWRTRDTSVAAVGAATGVLRLKKAANDSVWARMDTVERGQKIVVRQVASSMSKFAGDTQTVVVAKNAATPPTVTVLDAGATPIAGDTVVFRAVTGINALVQDTLQVTDANGRAKPTSWKVGDVVGVSTMIAQSRSVPALTQSFSATAIPGPARRVAFLVHPVTGAIGAAITPTIQVEIQDSLGNRVTSATNVITLGIGNNPGAASLGGTVSVAAVAGVASFNDITVNNSGAGYTLVASTSGLTASTSNAFDAFGVAAKVAFFSVPASTPVGVPVSSPIRTAVQDVNGVIVRTSSAVITVSASTIPVSGAMSCACTGAAATGIAAFTPTFTAPGTWALTASAAGLASGTSADFTVTGVGAPAKLAFAVNPPATSVSKTALAPAITVQVQDANGALVASSSQSVTLALDPSSPAGATLSGTTTVAASGGVATFSNLNVDKAGTGYKLVATAGGSGLTSATSSAFAITFGAATKLGFVQQPTSTIAGVTMSPAVTVEAEDAGGNRVTNNAASISLSLATCVGTLSGGNAVAASGGVATFGGLSVASAATGCTLSASASGLAGASSTAFDIGSAATAVKLKFTTQPTSTTAGTTLPAFVAAVQNNAGGAATTSAPEGISISVVSGAGVIVGTTNCLSNFGCTFSNVSFTKADTYRLQVFAAGLRPDTSAQFTISAAAANQVAFVSQPTNVVGGTPFSPVVTAAVQDQYGNTVTGATNAVSITAGGKVNGSTVTLPFSNGATSVSVNASNGVATFTGLAIRKAATNGVLTVSATGLIGQGSSFFTITAGPASALGFAVQPSNAVISASITPAVQVQAQDSVGNAAVDFADAIGVSLSGGAVDATLGGIKSATPVSGTVSFSNLLIDKIANGYQLIASATGLPNATSNSFNVTAGPPSILTWTAPPVDGFAHKPLVGQNSLVTIEAQDATGHTATSFNGVVRVTASGPGSLLNNGVPVASVDFNAVAGVVAIPATQLSLPTAGPYLMTATTPSAGLTPATTSKSIVIAAFDSPAKLAWSNQPANGTYDVILPGAGGTAPTVSVQDQYGNVVTNATNSVSIVIGTDPSGSATLAGNGATGASGGSASFSALRLNKAGTGFTLVASSLGLTPGTSSAFNVTVPGIINGVGSVMHSVVVGGSVYYTKTNGNLASIALIGGAETSITPTLSPAQITSDGANVYWAEFNTSNNGDAAIRKLNISSGIITTLVTGLSNLCTPSVGATGTPLETDGTNVYFASQIAGKFVIQSIPVSAVNGTATALYTAPTGIPFFGLIGGFIYFEDEASHTISRMTTTGTALTTLTDATVTGSGQYSFAMDGTTLLYLNSVSVYSIPNAASASSPVTPATAVSSTNTVYAVATANGSVYVQIGGQIRRYASGDYTSFTVVPGANPPGSLQDLLFGGSNLLYYAGNGTFEKVPE